MSDLVGNPEDRFSRVAAQLYGLRIAVQPLSLSTKLCCKLLKYNDMFCFSFIGQDIISAGFSGALGAGVLTASAVLGRNLFNDLTTVAKEQQQTANKKNI